MRDASRCSPAGCGVPRQQSRWRSAVAAAAPAEAPWSDRGPVVFDAEKFARLPAEVVLRLLGRAIAQAGDERPIRLGKLEKLYETLASAKAAASGPGLRVRRTLGGALVTLAAGRLTVERAPPRAIVGAGRSNLTTAKYGGRGGPKRR